MIKLYNSVSAGGYLALEETQGSHSHYGIGRLEACPEVADAFGSPIQPDRNGDIVIDGVTMLALAGRLAEAGLPETYVDVGLLLLQPLSPDDSGAYIEVDSAAERVRVLNCLGLQWLSADDPLVRIAGQ